MFASIVTFAANAAVNLTGFPAIIFTVVLCFPRKTTTRLLWALAGAVLTTPFSYSARTRVAEQLGRPAPDLFAVGFSLAAYFVAWALIVSAVWWVATTASRTFNRN